MPIFQSWAQYTVKTRRDRRDAIRARLQTAGIPTAVYYPIPLHRQPAYAQTNAPPLPIAEALSQQVFSLPIHPYLDAAQQTQVIKAIKTAVCD